MSPRRLRARVDRVEQREGAATGQDRDRERPRHAQAADGHAPPTGSADAEKLATAKLEARRRADQDRDRFFDLLRQKLKRPLTDAEQIELDELERRFPPDAYSDLDKAILVFRVEHGQL
jgi:hypothetical protein